MCTSCSLTLYCRVLEHRNTQGSSQASRWDSPEALCFLSPNYWLYKSNCMNKSEAKCSSCHYIHIVKQTDNSAVRIGYLDRFPPCSTWVVCFCKIACSAGCVSMDVLFFSSTLLLQVFMSEWTSVVSAEERQVSLLELNEKSLALSLF